MQGSQQYKFSCSLLTLVKDANSFTAILSQHINDPISFAATLCKNPMALSSMIAPMKYLQSSHEKDQVAGHTLFLSHCFFVFVYIKCIYPFLMSLTEPIEHSLDDQHLKKKDSQQEISCHHIGRHF